MRPTASPGGITSNVRWVTPVSWPSLTTSVIVCSPTAITLVARTPSANGLAGSDSNQRNVSGSFSISDELEPSRITVAAVMSGARINCSELVRQSENNGETSPIATGGSLTGLTVSVTVATIESTLPSLALKLKLSGPKYFVAPR